ncbi:MAG: DOMON domain-containing protein [Desulfobacteraceae bacterium]|nr:DOMON domain-containing protein [Desulfobacteraceae bacterium]
MKKSLILTLTTIAFLLVSTLSLWAMDYQHNLKAKDMAFSWSIEGNQIHVKLSAKTTGWVGIGFNPDNVMQNANIIIGAVKKGKVKIQDHFADKKRGHSSDKKQGGKSHVQKAAGSEENGITTISFTIPLNSGEKLDTPIKADGTDIVMLAYGGGRDNFSGRHPFRAVYKVNLKTGDYKKVK